MNLRIPPSHFRRFAKRVKAERLDAVNDIKSIGFGHLLNVDLPAIKVKWDAEFLSHFEVDSCSLVLPNLKKIQITADDVTTFMAFQKGI